jgi:PAS domain S-box-containing protein
MVMILPLLLGLLAASLLMLAARQDSVKLQQLAAAQAITFESINLMSIGRDVARHPEEQRAVKQWWITSQHLTELLLRVDVAGYQERVERMRREQRILDDFFQRLAQTGNPEHAPLFPVLLQRLESQMALHAQTLAAEAGNLMRDIQSEQLLERQQVDSLIIGLLLMLTLTLTLVSGVSGRRLLQRLKRLQVATTQVGVGNLDYRIGDVQGDELGEFACAFDEMTGNLKQVTARRDVLLREIEARERAQTELQGYKNHLEELVATRTLELEQSNRQLRETQFAMDRSGIAIQWLDAENGRLLSVNDQAGAMLDYSRDELLRRYMSDICADFAAERFQALAMLCHEQGYTRFESVYRARDGRELPVEIVLYYQPPLSEVSGRYIAFVSDISQRKAAEQALLQAKNAAETANRAKSVFLSNMSHELRTPLNAILGFAQLMERDPVLAETHRRELATIHRSGHHLLALINDVLEISRIEAGRTSINKQNFDLTECLSAITEMIHVRAEQKALDFVVDQQGQLPGYVYGDAHHLRQVLINLLGNAVKYTDQGSITLRLTPVEDSIRFQVIDTGPGIAANDLPLIFQAFYQTDVGIAKGEGTGLGLAISTEFVRLMGGEISVNSEVGKGSLFEFTLPLPEANAPVMTDAQHRVIGLAADQAPVRVLVVDDNADNRELISLLLEGIGIQVKSVVDGRQAVACFETWHPHFIWMDMRMPVLNGYEATKIIRSLPGGKEVKIAALTASAFKEDQNAILAAGCDDMLAKPVDEYHLFRLMGDLLGLHFQFADGEMGDQDRPRPLDEALDLSVLNAELRGKLAKAAKLLDAEAIQAVIECIRPEYPEQAKAIAAWVDAYRFEVLVKMCRDAEITLGNTHE